jgi:hypothetical protein
MAQRAHLGRGRHRRHTSHLLTRLVQALAQQAQRPQLSGSGGCASQAAELQGRPKQPALQAG